jgi:3-(methylthio)propionyl---CoA ligase
MHGLMQDWPLTVDRILDHGATWHGRREVVGRPIEGGALVRTTYGEIRSRAKRLSNALRARGIGRGDRVATLAFNTARHVEAWYAVMGMGAVCHTLNPRLFPEQLVYIINHAEDRLIFADICVAPILEGLLPHCPKVETVVWLTSEAHLPASPAGVSYERFIADQSEDCVWGDFPETEAAGLCYTSGTTGNPKGVLYSHRSNYLHTLMSLQADVTGLSSADNVLMVVPMFHANAWGLAFSAPAVGAKLVMPGAQMDGASILELLETEEITFAGAVPTVFQMLLLHLEKTGARLPHLRKVVIGGAACPEAIIRTFHDKYDVEVLHLWGMTEMSPMGSVGAPCATVKALPYDEQMPFRLKQGRVPLGVDAKLTDDEGRRLPHDGRSFGRLMVRGHSVVGAYFKGDGGEILDKEGFFDTGDVATLCPYGYIQITDRAKDVIKSGGEWISSIEIENIASGHPKAALAAVVGLPHPKWDERPLLIVQLKPGESAAKDEFLHFLEGKIARWWMPNDVVFDTIPLGATGKIDKKLIRHNYEGYHWPEAAAAE